MLNTTSFHQLRPGKPASAAASGRERPASRWENRDVVTFRVDLTGGRSAYVSIPRGPGPGMIQVSTPDAGLLQRLRRAHALLQETVKSGPPGLELVIQGLKAGGPRV